MNALVVAYGRSGGDVLFDPSLPVEDVRATIHSGALGYYRSIGLFGRSANIRIGMPYALGNMRGLLAGADTEIYRSGVADMRVQISANLIGAPQMNLRQFAEYRRGTTIWSSLAMVIPTGQYDPARLINIGTNRWAFKPEMAMSQATGKWTVEGYAAAWLFTKNPQFQGNHVRKQSPLLTYQVHLSRNLKPGLWWAADFTYYHGGASQIGEVERQDFLRNARLGLTVFHTR
ncbi:MAG: transporter [Bryobacteraceae bacterium]